MGVVVPPPLRAAAAGLVLLVLAGVAPTWRTLRGTALEVSPQAREGAVAAVRDLNAITRHLLASAGDRRFAERLAASDLVVGETLAGAQFARERLGLVDDPTLVRFDVLDVGAGEGDAVRVRTREYWVFREHPVSTVVNEGPPIAAVVIARYEVVRQGNAWAVADWAVERPRPGE